MEAERTERNPEWTQPWIDQGALSASEDAAVSPEAQLRAARARIEQLSGQLARQQHLLGTVLESLPVAVTYLDRDLTYRLCNSAAATALGKPVQEILGRRLTDVMPDNHHLPEALEAAMRAGEPHPQPILTLRPPGRPQEERHYLVAYLPHTDQSGQVWGVLMSSQDVTEMVRARAQVERQIGQRNALLEELAEAVLITDGEGRIVLRNRVSREISGLSDDEANSLSTQLARGQLLYPDGRRMPERAHPLRRLAAGQRFTDYEVVYQRDDASPLHLLFSGNSLRDDEGRMTMGILVYRDVTELRRLERMREEFVATVSHDLRSPLTAVQGNSQLISRAADQPARVRALAEAVTESTRRMNAMIQDLVDSTRLESGQISLDRVPVDVGSTISELVRRSAGTLDEERLRLEVGPALPPALADPVCLDRILTNLITNAFKYSREEVTVRVTPADGEISIAVIDRGLGIPPEEQAKLFSRYYRTRAGQERHEGLGLGLYIAKMLVEANGGRIWVESEQGVGSTFSFTVPAVAGSSGAGSRRDLSC
jgi:two-component system, NtrC family, sensor histidine kinase KinB